MSGRNDHRDDVVVDDDDDDIEAATATAAKSLPSSSHNNTQQHCYSRCPELFPHLYFRSIQPSDRQQIEALHEDWFPVVYSSDFYDALVHGQLSAAAEEYQDSRNSSTTCCQIIEEGEDDDDDDDDSNHHFLKDDLERNNCTLPRKTPQRSKPLVTYLAVENCNSKSNNKEQPGHRRMNDPYTRLTNDRHNWNQNIRIQSTANVDDDDDEHDESYSRCRLSSPQSGQSSSSQTHHDRIVACVVGAFVEHTILSEELQTMLIPNTTQHTRLFYIMTLGTVSDYRRTGLASHLVQQCCQVATAVSECGTVYLHVLDTNEAAIRFYEKLGFYRVKLIPNYYSIHGRPRHCYLYAKYLNGNRGHLTILTRLKRVIQIVWQQLTSPLSLWTIDQPTKATEFVARHGQNEMTEV